jgi:NADH:ubiquinone oxidoreductase subunit 2 (subunit N)
VPARCVARLLGRGHRASGASSRRSSAGVVFDRSPDPTSCSPRPSRATSSARSPAIILALIGLVVVLVSWSDGRRDHVGEYYALLAASAAGMVFIVSASSLLTMFLALEWFSIALYILCALDTHRRESLEAGLKYLIIGSFGSGILLFGCALVYGSTGELGFSAIREATGADDPLFVTGMAMILAGLAFKVSAAPFHMWTPTSTRAPDLRDGVHGRRDEGRGASS